MESRRATTLARWAGNTGPLLHAGSTHDGAS